MFPLRDLNPSRRTPWVTWSIILLCALVWVFQAVQPPGAQHEIMEGYALVPAHVTRMLGEGFDGPTVLSVFASMFMHGGLMHVAGNLWFLWIFGDNVEDNLGHLRFALFYLLGGVAAATMQWAVDPSSTIPMVGASGAIASVLAGYMVLYPRARVKTLLTLVVFFSVVVLPAWLVIAFWFAMQFFAGVMSLGVHTGGVAYWAHIGGFVGGLLLVLLMRRPKVAAVGPAVVPDPTMDERWRFPGGGRDLPGRESRPWDRSDGW